MKPTLLAASLLALAPVLAPAQAHAGTLSLFVTGEELATEGFIAPQTTRDGWELRFHRILVTFDQVTAWQTDPPFDASGPDIDGQALEFGGPFTVDLLDADDAGRLRLATIPAQAGHYNALSWALVPAETGPAAGYALMLDGTARRDGAEIAFSLRSADRVAHACGEYLGDARKGFVTDGADADVEITLHLDHLFGRADKGADDPMNLSAPGFDPFATGGAQDFSLSGLHLGHVGEGHCHVSDL